MLEEPRIRYPGGPALARHRRIGRTALRRNGIRTGRHTAVPAAAGDSREVETLRAATRVALFTVMCLVFMFISSRCSGSSDSTPAPPTARCSPTCRGSGRQLRADRRRGGRQGQDMTLHKDGTVTVDFAIDKGLQLTQGTQGRGATRTSSVTATCRWRRVPARCANCFPGRPFRWTAPRRTRRRRTDRRLPAVVPGARPRAGERPVRAAAAGLPGPGRNDLLGTVCADSALTTTLAGRDQLIGGHHQPEHRARNVRHPRRPVRCRSGQTVRAGAGAGRPSW